MELYTLEQLIVHNECVTLVRMEDRLLDGIVLMRSSLMEIGAREKDFHDEWKRVSASPREKWIAYLGVDGYIDVRSMYKVYLVQSTYVVI